MRGKAPFVALSNSQVLTKMFDRQCEAAQIEKKPGRSFHSLRRSFGTWLAREQVPITTIAQMLGHTDMDSSRVYLSFNDAQLSKCAMDFSEIPVKQRLSPWTS